MRLSMIQTFKFQKWWCISRSEDPPLMRHQIGIYTIYIVQYVYFTEDTPWSANFRWYGVRSRSVFLCIDILLFSAKPCFFSAELFHSFFWRDVISVNKYYSSRRLYAETLDKIIIMKCCQTYCFFVFCFLIFT